MWCLMFIWYPSEVTEAISLASATSRSDQWQSHRKSKVQKFTFFEKSIFQFFIISRVIFDLQRRTIPQINCLKILFWPFALIFRAKMDIWGDTMRRKCLVFFPRLYLLNCNLEFITHIKEKFKKPPRLAQLVKASSLLLGFVKENYCLGLTL